MRLSALSVPLLPEAMECCTFRSPKCLGSMEVVAGGEEFAAIGLQGTAFAIEAKHSAPVTNANYSVAKDAEKNQIGSTKALPLQARITLGSSKKIIGGCYYWPQDCG